MKTVIDGFYNLMMSQQFDFVEYFLNEAGPENPEKEVVKLYQQFKNIPEEQQKVVENMVKSWAFSLTIEEMFIGANNEKILRSKE